MVLSSFSKAADTSGAKLLLGKTEIPSISNFDSYGANANWIYIEQTDTLLLPATTGVYSIKKDKTIQMQILSSETYGANLMIAPIKNDSGEFDIYAFLGRDADNSTCYLETHKYNIETNTWTIVTDGGNYLYRPYNNLSYDYVSKTLVMKASNSNTYKKIATDGTIVAATSTNWNNSSQNYNMSNPVAFNILEDGTIEEITAESFKYLIDVNKLYNSESTYDHIINIDLVSSINFNARFFNNHSSVPSSNWYTNPTKVGILAIAPWGFVIGGSYLQFNGDHSPLLLTER